MPPCLIVFKYGGFSFFVLVFYLVSVFYGERVSLVWWR